MTACKDDGTQAGLGKRTLESSKELALLLKERRELESEMNISDYDDGEEKSEDDKADAKDSPNLRYQIYTNIYKYR